MAKMVSTVCGPVSVDSLGGVLSHEHFVFGYPGYQGDETATVFDKKAFFGEMKRTADHLKEHGVKTIVDATPNDCGRDVRLLKELSEHLEMNIICCTGYYSQDAGAPSYFQFRKTIGMDVEAEIYDMLKTELEQGVADTGIKPAAIKLGSSFESITDYEMWFFKAAAKLARENSDVRIMTHITAATCAAAQAQFFMDEGVNPKQVQIGHICDVTDLTELEKVFSKGFYGGYDRFGQEGLFGCPYDTERFGTLYGLIGLGHEDQLMLSVDWIEYILGRATEIPKVVIDTHFKNCKMEYIVDGVIPTLKKMGVTDAQIDKLMVKNPARFWAGE